MTRDIRRRSYGAWIFAIMILFAIPAQAGADREIRKSFEVRPGGTLTLDTDLGAIEIRTHRMPRVDLFVTIDAHDSDDADDFGVTFQHRGADLSVEGDYDSGGRGWFGFLHGSSRLRVRWQIVVPEQYTLDLRTAGGSIEVSELRGDVQARTSGGSLRFGRVEGKVQGRTSGGSITIEETSGEVDLSTSGGGIQIERARGNVRARTSGGSIRVDEVFGSIDAVTSGGSISASLSEQPSHDCRLSTSGGSVTVYLAPAIALDLDARTSGGRVSSDMPITVRGEIKKTSLSGELNGGGPSLVLRTSGGGISIRSL